MVVGLHENGSEFDKALLQPLQSHVANKILVVCGQELIELGLDGRILHQLGGFNSLSDATRLGNGY